MRREGKHFFNLNLSGNIKTTKKQKQIEHVFLSLFWYYSMHQGQGEKKLK